MEIEDDSIKGKEFDAYRKAKFLSVKFPSPYTEKMLETFKKIEDELEAIPDFFPESIVIKKYLRTEWLPLIVEKISEILHGMEKTGDKIRQDGIKILLR